MKSFFATLLFFHGLFLPGMAQSRPAFIHRLYPAPLSLLQVDLQVKCSNRAGARCWLRFYDSLDHLLLAYPGEPLAAAPAFQKTGFYTEAPPFTRYAELTVEPDSGVGGGIAVDSFRAKLHAGEPEKFPASGIDMDEYMRPFWRSDTIFNETVLLLSKQGAPAMGNLLYMPDQVLSVRSFDQRNVFSEKTDYRIKGRTIMRRENSRMPFRADTSFDTKNDLAWFNLQSQWVLLTYTHKDKWMGPVPGFRGNLLPETLGKLRSRAPLNIVAYGMSITRGLNVSGYDSVPPYMPTYMQLFAAALGKIYGDEQIRLYNAALPGALVSWGAEYAGRYINPLRPDLVVLDFGMNDFWRYDPEQFRKYMETIVRKVREANPHAEFLLLSNMQFDPDYILDSDKHKNFYLENMQGYAAVLRSMETTGIVNLDMNTISGILYTKKKAKDCIANPLHPNDYLARWYAQGMTTLFLP
jgi:lysophospholipase L1-like esterase